MHEHDDNNPDCPWNYPPPLVKGTPCDCGPRRSFEEQMDEIRKRAEERRNQGTTERRIVFEGTLSVF